MFKHILLFLLLPLLANAQLKEFEMSEMPRPDVAVVQASRDFPEDALLLVYSSILELNFRSSLGAIDKMSFNPTANRYEILVRPYKQMVFVYRKDFMEQKVSTINPNPKDVLYFKVEEKKQAVVSTEPGMLKITTEPSGAEITLNGIPVSTKTPFTGELPGAVYGIKLQKPKHETVDTLIAILGGETSKLSVQMRPTTLWVNISSMPSGAAVMLDGTPRGITPASFELDLTDASKRGSRPLRLTLSDHETVSTSVDLRPSATPMDLKYILDKQKGSFSINSMPEGAQVFTGGQYKGTTPLKGRLEVGQYEVEVRLEGYTTPKQTLKIQSTSTSELSFRMRNRLALPIAIGQEYGGGVVFEIGKGGHGLVVALKDQSSAAEWDKAKELCEADTGGGFTDWYLPSKDELRKLYKNSRMVNEALKASGGAEISQKFYWSSVDYNFRFAWIFNFSNGVSDFYFETDKYCVRAVRAF